ncbi:hypothetical protein RhiirB3_436755 [Rhizophagus irregularis]|nr:hypothetical protein RhiirB3_436755 [Rhizophagus irregularis]
MFHYPPKLSISLDENDSPPSMLFCPNYKNSSFKIESAYYYESIYNYNKKNPLVNLIDSKVFQNIPRNNNNCGFFNGTLFPSFLEKNFAGGVYVLIFNSSEVVIYMVELFSNIGGYLSIWGIIVFLFGHDKMDPFGFVSRFVFIEQDKTKLLEELKKMQYDRSIKRNKIDIVTEKSKLDDQVELENLLAKYYVHMDFYKHAVKTSDV